ncbi:OmpA family protein [Flavobacterium sp. AC]|uniref:OmpA family protein n=1 Tax=Flavobacterium azizsancarii TaxID=2961580 RepID=A0ABT4W7P0_9FLAO|nr:OmpA family protein [Flavobacterium azizsancarii]MDA6068110.1 OmpA family protein [Flavobacterium azizsancarii]
MKKIVMTLAFALTVAYANAQTEKSSTAYNKWSVELGGGVNKPQRPMSSNYFTSTPSPWVGDLGVRYMFNNKFGLKADFGYNSFTGKNNSIDFDSKYYRADLQAVANLGRIMNFESWTKTFGLLGHAGFGLAQLENKDLHVKDRMGNFIAGVTGQVRLSDRFALTGDFTTILNASQDATFDGATTADSRGFTGILFNGTVGLQVYLGKNAKHADWTVISESQDLTELQNKLNELETLVANKPTEVIVEKIVAAVPVVAVPQKDVVKEMINDQYYSVYFDFNKSTPIENSTAAIDVVLTYLRKNPSASLDIIGHADQVGKAEYNNKLSNTRAKNVKTILEKAGIESSRLNTVAAGSDNSIDKDPAEARRLARRVTFNVR